MTYRHAVKDADNNVPFGETLPVHYNALAGLTVEETESLQDYDAFPVVGSGVFEGVEGTGGIFRDMIQVQDAEVLFHYADAFYLEFAAVTRKQTGRGTLYYVGCGLEEKITKLLMEQVMRAEQKEDSADGCRTGTGEKYDGPAARGGDPCIWKTLGRRAEQLS